MSVQGPKGEIGGLLGRELDAPTKSQPVGGDHVQFLPSVADQVQGIPIGFTTYRAPDITGRFPEWYQTMVKNYGDIDEPPVGIPMGPRHFNIQGRIPMPVGE